MEEKNNTIRETNKHATNRATSQQVDLDNSESVATEKSIGELKLMVDVLEDIQSNLEPIRDKALDEKARLTGYSQCAEAMVKIIADRASFYKKQAIEAVRRQHGVKQKNSSSKISEQHKAENRQEEQSLGDDSATQRERV